MISKENKEKIKRFFEEYYDLIAQEYILFLERCNIPSEMLEGKVDEEGYGKWKLVPSNITKDEINLLEEELGIEIPELFKSFLTTYFHYFNEFVGENPVNNHFAEIKRNKIPCFLNNGFLPFCWDEEDAFIFCIDTTDENCPVYKVDHDIAYDLKPEIKKNELRDCLEKVSDSLISYLDKLLLEKKKDGNIINKNR